MAKPFIIRLLNAEGKVVANSRIITYNDTTSNSSVITASDFADNSLTGNISINCQKFGSITKTFRIPSPSPSPTPTPTPTPSASFRPIPSPTPTPTPTPTPSTIVPLYLLKLSSDVSISFNDPKLGSTVYETPGMNRLYCDMTTRFVADGTVLYWKLTAPGGGLQAGSAADVFYTTGSFTIRNNAGKFTVYATEDLVYEGGPDFFRISVTTGSANGPEVANGFFAIIDKDPVPQPTPTPSPSVVPTPTPTPTITPTPTPTQSPVPPPTVTLTGPACINSAGSNTFVVTANQPIVLNRTSLDAAFLQGKLTITEVIPNEITINGYSSSWTIRATSSGIPYNILETGTAVMNGTTGLSLLVDNPITLAGSLGDDRVTAITLPFSISFPTSPTAFVSGTNIVVGTNSFISLGNYTGTGFPPTLYDPPFPSIFIGTRDCGMFKLYSGSRDGNSTYIIRWEGVKTYTEGTSYAAVNRIWEAVFYQANPTRVTIRTDSTKWDTEGASFIKNADTILYPSDNTYLNLAPGNFTTLEASYLAYVPAGTATNTVGFGNSESNRLNIVGC